MVGAIRLVCLLEIGAGGCLGSQSQRFRGPMSSWTHTGEKRLAPVSTENAVLPRVAPSNSPYLMRYPKLALLYTHNTSTSKGHYACPTLT